MNLHKQRLLEQMAEDEGYHAALNYVASRKLGFDAPRPVNSKLSDLKNFSENWQKSFDETVAKHLESQ